MTTILRSLALAFVLFVTVGVAHAAPPQPNQPAANEGWEPVNGDMMQPGETIPASRLVGAAYGFIFTALVVWIVSIAARERRVEEELAELERKLEAKGK